MAKDDEIAYLSRMGDEGRRHALDKPWSDPARGRYLQEFGAILDVLPPAPARVLDLGAGSGWTSCFLACGGYSVTSTDIAPDMVELQRLNANRYGAPLEAAVVCDFESLPFESEFDAVLFYDCLHHAEDEVRALRSAHRALKPGGVCITLEPGRGHARAHHSVTARALYGTNERDMPPSTILRAARQVGFARHAVYSRPPPTMMLTRGRWPRPSVLVPLITQLVMRATPLAMTRGHLVVLTK